MKIYFTLVKALLKQSYRVDHSLNKKSKKSKTWLVYLIATIACIPLGIMLGYITFLIGQVTVTFGISTEMFTIIITGTQLIVLFFGILTLLNNVYFSKDAEIILSLPIRPSVAYAAKMTVVYFYEMITVLFVLIVCFIPYGIGLGANAFYYIMLIPTVILLPIIPLLIASIVSIPLMYIVSFFKNKAVLSSIASVLIFIIVFGGYMFLVISLGSNSVGDGEIIDINLLIEQALNAIKSFANAVFPNLALAKVVFASGVGVFFLNLAISIGINGVVLAITIYISSFVYTRSISKQLETPQSSSTKKGVFGGTGYMKELIKKEWLGIIRFPSLSFMCLMQIVLAPLMTIMICIPFTSNMEASKLIFDLMAQFPDVVAFTLVALVTIAISSNYAAMGGITREGENFFIMKIIPVSVPQQLEAKAFLAIIFNLIPTVICCLVFAIVLRLNFIYVILAFIVISLLGIALTYLQLTLDLKKPNIKWDNISQGMKNNHSAVFSAFIGMGVTAVIIGIAVLSVFASINGLNYISYIFWGLLVLIGLVSSFYCRNYLLTNASRLMSKIEP